MSALPQPIAESWIGRFVKYCEPLPTPAIFKLWAGIACVMGALERRVYLRSVRKNLFASHYILLVAPPGVGKSMVIAEVKNFWEMAGGLKIGPDAATKAAMVDQLKLANRMIKLGDGTIDSFHSLQIASTEFATLIKAQDDETLNFYNRIWDCEDKHTENLRYGDAKEVKIDYPQIHILAGTQPAYLGKILPDEAFGMGFAARLVLIYSAEAIRPKLFDDEADEVDLHSQQNYKELLKDLKRIVGLVGRMRLTPEAKAYLEEWHHRNDDAPEHPKLTTYAIRRTLTAQKIAMALAAAQNSKLLIDLPTVEATIKIMRDAEAVMPEIFKGMVVPKTSAVMAELHAFAFTYYAKRNSAPIPEHVLIAFLKNKVEAHQIDPIMKHMVSAGMLKLAENKQTPGKFEVIEGKRYIPVNMAMQASALLS